MPSSDRRTFLNTIGVGSVSLLAGCSELSGTTTGDLFVRARNITPAEQTVSIQLSIGEEETPSIEDSTTLPGATGDTPPWPEHIWHRENVRATESYRVVTVIDGQRYEQQDVANCINENREGKTEFSAYHEVADISIRSGKVKILTEDCPVDN
jgi:hypothetical protein